MDSNYYRQQRTLKRRRLRPSAVPTIFPNCPTFMTKSAAPIRSTTSSAASRFNREEISHELHVDAFFDDDKVSDLSDLTSKLKLSVLPSGFFLSEVEAGVLKCLLNTDDIPCISTSFFINFDLSWNAYRSNFNLPKSSLTILSSTIETVSSVLHDE